MVVKDLETAEDSRLLITIRPRVFCGEEAGGLRQELCNHALELP